MAKSILVISDWIYDRTKVERHIDPLAETAEVTMVCITETDATENIKFRTVPSFGIRYLGLCMMFIAAIREVYENEYDGVASFSLFPHGCFALATAKLFSLPVHLGIVGIDIDHHLKGSYRPLTALIIRQFDVVSVPGTMHRDELEKIGVPPRRVAILTNPVDISTYKPMDSSETRYDCVWVGRLATEKNPLLFVDCIERLQQSTERDIRAVMVGDGALRSSVEERINAADLEEIIDLPGWVDNPVEYYWQSKTYVLTSSRDALPLTLIEAMATGLSSVVPRVGNIPDIVDNGSNAIALDTLDHQSLAAEVQILLEDEELRRRIGRNAQAVRKQYSSERAAEDWKQIIDIMEPP